MLLSSPLESTRESECWACVRALFAAVPGRVFRRHNPHTPIDVTTTSMDHAQTSLQKHAHTVTRLAGRGAIPHLKNTPLTV